MQWEERSERIDLRSQVFLNVSIRFSLWHAALLPSCFSGICIPADSGPGQENKVGATFLQSWHYPSVARGKFFICLLSDQQVWFDLFKWQQTAGHKLDHINFLSAQLTYFSLKQQCINQTAPRSAYLVTAESATQMQMFSFSHKCHSLIRLAAVFVSLGLQSIHQQVGTIF